MSLFEFIVGLYVVIAGLGVTLLARSVGQMLESRKQIEFYWVHTCWLGFVFVAHVNSWFALWDYRDIDRWTVGQFLLLLAVPMLLYLASHVSVPEIPENSDTRFDMHTYYDERHRLLLGLIALAQGFGLIGEYLLRESTIMTPANWSRLTVLALLLTGLVSHGRRAQAAVTIGILLVLIYGLGFVGHPIE